MNPGEGWAETFRVLNQRRLGVAESPWEIVTQSLYPTAAALTAAEQDVVDPWRAGTSTAQTGGHADLEDANVHPVHSLDGTLKVTLRSSAGLRLALDVYASSTRVEHAAGSGTLSRSAAVCGARTYRIRVTEVRGKGTFRLTEAKP